MQLTLWPMLERGEIVYVTDPFNLPEYRCGHWSEDHTYVMAVRARTKEEVIKWLDQNEVEWAKNQ